MPTNVPAVTVPTPKFADDAATFPVDIEPLVAVPVTFKIFTEAVPVTFKVPKVTVDGNVNVTVPVVLLALIFVLPKIDVTPVFVIVIDPVIFETEMPVLGVKPVTPVFVIVTLPVVPDVDNPGPALRPETPRVERGTHVGVDAPFDCNIEPLVPTAVKLVPEPVW